MKEEYNEFAFECVHSALLDKREVFSNAAIHYIEQVGSYIKNYDDFLSFSRGENLPKYCYVPNLRHVLSLADNGFVGGTQAEYIEFVGNKISEFRKQIGRLKESPLEVYSSGNLNELKKFVSGIGAHLEHNYDLDSDDLSLR